MLIKSNSKLFQTYKRFRSYLGRPKLVVQTKPVIISDENQTNNPIFLIGIHRSGTSLVRRDRKSTRLNSSHTVISYAVFCLKKKKNNNNNNQKKKINRR